MKTFYGDKYYSSSAAIPSEDIARLLDSLEFSTLGIFIDGNVPPGAFAGSTYPRASFVERIDGGERAKTLSTVTRIVNSHQRDLDKNSLVLVVGGGAVLDLLGLCCGLMYRGIRYGSVPTSMIAMADAAYGGKTAVNHGAKNQIGMYHHPQFVYVNARFLQTLPDLHLKSGMIEIVKLAMFFDDIRASVANLCAGDAQPIDVALLAARRKLELLEQDPFEETSASVLLYGHPFGNAFETFARTQHGHHVPHGFAVGLGISFSAWLTGRLGLGLGRHVEELAMIRVWFDPVAFALDSTPPTAEEMVALLARDKYVSGEGIKVPAICDFAGYTRVSLDRIATEYDAWRNWLLSKGQDAKERPVSSDALGEPSLYIAGAPTDETVAPLRFGSADGPFIITTSGKRILDWSTCLNAPFGHSDRVDTSMLPVNAGNYPTEQRDALVDRLRDLFPFLSGFQFRSSGTEAVEAGHRYLRAALGTALQTVSIEGCYHGLTLAAQSLMGAGNSSARATQLPFAALSEPALVRRELEAALQKGPVAVWLEGVQGATLRRLPPGFLEVLIGLRTQHRGRLILVSDDMLASIRCGGWCSLSGMLEPDVLVAGKSWANGYPFSFFGVAQWIRSAAGDLLGTTSYGGNPIACVNAVHAIDRIRRERILDQIRARESAYAPTLTERIGSLPAVLRCEWHGLLFGFEMAGAELALRTARRAAAAGLLVSQLGPVIRCSPPINMTTDHLEWGLATMEQAVQPTP